MDLDQIVTQLVVDYACKWLFEIKAEHFIWLFFISDPEWPVDHQESANSLTQLEDVGMEIGVVLSTMSTENHLAGFMGKTNQWCMFVFELAAGCIVHVHVQQINFTMPNSLFR